jgi:hypothetical protein
MAAAFRYLAVASVLALFALLAGCTHYAPLPAGNFDVHGKLIVSLDRKWSRQVEGPSRIWPEAWTINGPLLDTLNVAVAIEDGRPLVKVDGEAAKNFPRFRAGMGAEDIVGLVQSTLAVTIKAGDFEARAIEPARVAGHDGVRFEFTFGTGTAGEGLETDRHAVGVAFEADKRLYLILFHAAELHYFPELRGAAEAVIASARLPGKSG